MTVKRAPKQEEGAVFAPLAERLRPRNLNEVLGQTKLLGPGRPLRRMVERGTLQSMILWGPPGTGKTTRARAIAESVRAPFHALSAISSSVREVREVIAQAAEENKASEARTILFIDEIHRFNKSQQDALLGAVEQGLLTLIGATTENPSFEVISPLLSRSRVFVLDTLSREDLEKLITRAMTEDEELRQEEAVLDDDARNVLIALSGGDARKLLNALELAYQLADRNDKGQLDISVETAEAAYGRKASRYDKGGEQHYDIISAFIKSMRGSDPDAALYWLARMIEAGEDVEFIARRMIIFASEDIGNADPNALLLATSCWDAVRAVGWPESQIIFAHVVCYLASAVKSNATYMGLLAAQADVAKHPDEPVPLHLRNAPTKLMKSLGYHEGYQYAHSYEGHFAPGMTYLPEGSESKVYYEPTELGREKAIAERLRALWPGRRK